jgi:hypothetical protein
MRSSNKVLLIAVAAVLLIILTFVVVMGLSIRDLIEARGSVALAPNAPVAADLRAAADSVAATGRGTATR